MMDYKRLGYSDSWINQRLKSIEIRKDLTDEWKKHNLQEDIQFATLTDIIYKTWAGKTAKEYKQFKGLKKENLRDNMTNTELVLNMLAEAATTDLSKEKDPKEFQELGHSVVSPLNAKKTLGLNKENKKGHTS